jgi:hypothetical protein
MSLGEFLEGLPQIPTRLREFLLEFHAALLELKIPFAELHLSLTMTVILLL